ncbi:uncharacterized protein FIBRA_05512 [Fibroporia radiculosa]|uniref:Uncharacterized protein n=1 Tax=Fibroporia radiculosa TaxID=599839 RepID=J4HXP0_9APHY|nr:uncharacterized protein FIBRA_05512 [Fibroporia radiculosa]CCM03382.1 predicted protein [Fibroporia radiculosa]
MRRSGAPRIHRLPQRLDYTLIPAPLALPLVDEKAVLPAIIVTPSSPSHDGDFAIAFLMPPPKPTFLQRVTKLLPALPRPPAQIQLPMTPKPESQRLWSYTTRARATVLLILLLFIMACHVVMHQLASSRPHLEFGVRPDSEYLGFGTHDPVDSSSITVDAHVPKDLDPPAVGGWFDLNALWAPVSAAESKRAHFIVWETDPRAA